MKNRKAWKDIMEIEMVCGVESVIMLSSYLETIRRDWIHAYIKWGTNKKDTYPIIQLQKCIQGHSIDKKLFRRIQCDCAIFNGLRCLVEKNTWSQYDSPFLLTTMLALTPYLYVLSPRDFDPDSQYFLWYIFSQSVIFHRNIQLIALL